MTKEGLIIGEEGDDFLTAIDKKNGDTLYTTKLPATMERDDCLYVTPDGFCFFGHRGCRDDEVFFALYGGKLEKRGWISTFEIPSPPRLFFTAMGNAVKFYQLDNPKIVVIDSEGKTIESSKACKDIWLKGEDVYRLVREEDTLCLEVDKREKICAKIPIGKYKEGKIHGLVERGNWAIVSASPRRRSMERIIFVNLCTMESVDSGIIIDNNMYELHCCWDRASFIVKKITGALFRVNVAKEVDLPEEGGKELSKIDLKMGAPVEKLGDFPFSLADVEGETLFLSE